MMSSPVLANRNEDEIYIVQSGIVQQWMNYEYGFYRHWTNHSADKIEEILRKHALIPKEAHYVTYNPRTDMLEFIIPKYAETLPPSRFRRFKQWIIKLLSN
jgi:hypothetical protein